MIKLELNIGEFALLMHHLCMRRDELRRNQGLADGREGDESRLFWLEKEKELARLNRALWKKWSGNNGSSHQRRTPQHSRNFTLAQRAGAESGYRDADG